MRNQPPEFADVVLDSLDSHIAVLDANGVIIGVNEPWRRFAEHNGGPRGDAYVGESYLGVCEAALREGDEALRPLVHGLRSVLDGTLDHFALEYPCRGPHRQRWFMARVTPCRQRGESRVVVAHEDITTRKEAELGLLHARGQLTMTRETLEKANRALQKSLLREEKAARTDGLTGLCNRRHFFILAPALLNIATRYSKPLSLVMLDVDHLKQINDVYGHQVGDRALEQIARRAQTHVRTADVLARYGGEELVLVLPETDLIEAMGVAEAIRKSVCQHPLNTGREQLRLSVSAGVSELLGSGDTLDALLGRADHALLASKAAGRNRITAYENSDIEVMT